MSADIFAAMSVAFSTLTEPSTLLYLLIGVVIGSLLSVVPGVGGLMGLALLLPFTFSMSPIEAMTFLVAAMAVMSTADSIPAILFGVPGTPTSMVTVLDGYPMSKRGEAGRALGAAFTSSVLGGIIGAVILVILIPFVMPLLMGARSPELLAFCILGLAMVGTLAGGSMAKGLGAALIGVLIAFIGQEAQTATLRWTFDTFYLWDGVNILIVALGIYAIPELADLAIQNKSIAPDGERKNLSGARQGARDTIDNLWPVTRNSSLSSLLGIIPAIGPAVIPWLIYSYTTMRTKGKNLFGKGDVRGVIASESSNNATVGGSLLPTVALGVPGSAPMAILLGAMLLHGVAPGPDMLSRNLDMTYLMVWGIVAANVLGGLFALMLARPLSKVVFIRSSVLVPIITIVVFIGAVQSTRQWEDGILLVIIGLIGWVMKRVRWPRAPLFLAFILAPLVESYFFISMNVHGWAWTQRPIVAPLLIVTALFIIGLMISRYLKARRQLQGKPQWVFTPRVNLESVFAVIVMIICVLAFWTASQWPGGAGLMPRVAAALGVAMGLCALVGGWIHLVPRDGALPEDLHFDLETDFGDLKPRQILLRGLGYLAMLSVLGGLAVTFGMIYAIPVFLLFYLFVYRESWKLAIPVAAGYLIFAMVVFDNLLRLAWPAPLL